MARFFRTARPEFVDHIYEPNFDVQMKLADKQVESDLLRNQLISGVDDVQFEFWDFDKDRAAEIRQEYDTKLEELSQAMYSDPKNLNKHLRSLKAVQRDLTNDFTSGRINKLEQNAAAYKDYQTKLAALKSPTDRLAYSQMVNNYMARTGDKGGAYNSIFKPEDMIDSRNILNEFADSAIFKGLKPDEQEMVRDLSNGKYISIGKAGNKGLTEKKVLEAFQSWWLNDPGNMGYAESREKYFGQKFFDDKGNYVFDKPGYALNNIMFGAKNLAYNEHTESLSKTVDPYGKMAAEAAAKKDEEKSKEDYVQYLSNGVLKSLAGSNISEYDSNKKHTFEKMEDIRKDTSGIIRAELGLQDGEVLPESILRAIETGDFTTLMNLKSSDGSLMFTSPALRAMKDKYRDELINMAGIDGVRNEWENKMRKDWEKDNQGATFDEYLNNNQFLFNKHLKESGAIVIDQKFTWEGTGVTGKQFRDTAKYIIEGGMHEMYTIDLPQGTSMRKPDGTMMDVSGMSLAQMQNAGLVEREGVKVPIMSHTPARMSEADPTRELTPESYEIQYRLTDGSGFIGYSVSPNSIMPSTSYDDSRKIELGMIVNFRGQKTIAKIEGDALTTSSIKEFQNMNHDMLNTNYILSKWSNAEEVLVPGGSGVKVLTPKDKNGGVKGQFVQVPDGTGGYQTYSITDKGIREALSILLNE